MLTTVFLCHPLVISMNLELLQVRVLSYRTQGSNVPIFHLSGKDKKKVKLIFLNVWHLGRGRLVITDSLTCTDRLNELFGRHILIGEGNGSDGGTRLMVDCH